MSLISRITTWVNNQLLKSSDLNGEFNNIVNTINNLDSATTTWTNVKVTTLSPQANVAMGGFKLTGLAAGSANGDSIRYEQVNGQRILQIVTGAMGNVFTTTSTTYVVATGSTLTVTPKSSTSTIILIGIGLLGQSNPHTGFTYGSIMNGTAPLHIGTNGIVVTNDDLTVLATNFSVPVTMVATQAPGSVSAQTYNVGLKVTANTGYWNEGNNALGLFMAVEVG